MSEIGQGEGFLLDGDKEAIALRKPNRWPV
jgi:hypothetical protein